MAAIGTPLDILLQPNHCAKVDTAVMQVIEDGCRVNSKALRTRARYGARFACPAVASPVIKRYGPTDPEPLTYFHSISVPDFSLVHIARLVYSRFEAYSPVSTLQAAVLMLRFSESLGLPITLAMMHRMLLAALLVVGKAHHDFVPMTFEFATIAGVTLREMYRLEQTLLRGLRWRALVTGADIVSLLSALVPLSPAVDGVLASIRCHSSGAAPLGSAGSAADVGTPPSVSVMDAREQARRLEQQQQQQQQQTQGSAAPDTSASAWKPPYESDPDDTPSRGASGSGAADELRNPFAIVAPMQLTSSGSGGSGGASSGGGPSSSIPGGNASSQRQQSDETPATSVSPQVTS